MRDRPDIRIRKAESFRATGLRRCKRLMNDPYKSDVFEDISEILRAHALKQYDKAEEVLNTALIYSRKTWLLIDKANLLMKRKKFDEALAVPRSLKMPRALPRRIYGAQIYASREDVRSAIAALEQARLCLKKQVNLIPGNIPAGQLPSFH